MKRLGLIGVGAWGRTYAARIGARADCRIAAVARASSARSDVLAGATPSESWQALVGSAAGGELDGVIAATTPLHQAEIAVACAAQGVSLLVEKPLGLSAADVERVRERFEASARKAPLIVDYIHLWAAAFVQLKRRVAELGGSDSVLGITTEGFNHGPVRQFSSLYDYGAHDVAMALDLLGADAAFQLREVERKPAEAGYELHEARFVLGRVPVRMCVGNGAQHKMRRFAVELRGGSTLVYDDTRPHPHKLVEDDAPITIDPGGPLDAVLGHFLVQIEHWQAGRSTVEQSRKALHLSARVNAILNDLDASTQLRTT